MRYPMARIYSFQHQTRYPSMNRVTYHIYGRLDKKNSRGEIPLCLAVSINGQRDLIPLSVMVEHTLYDVQARRVKQKAEKSYIINEILSNAETKALEVLRDANASDIKLDKRTFRIRFASAFSDDFVAFWERNLAERLDSLKPETRKCHKSNLKKFKEFNPVVPFSSINVGLIERYEAYLIKRKNGVNTRRTALKVLNTYINRAINEGIPVKDPFKKYKKPSEVDTRESLTLAESHKLLEVFDKKELPDYLQSSLLSFIATSYTCMRIGDFKKFGEQMLKENKLIYMPEKTDRAEKIIKLELPAISRRILLEVIRYLESGGKFKSEQNINDDLKKIAVLTGVNPKLHNHMARHTFATNFLRIGGSQEVLQRIMGHSSIRTTQRYVHMIDERIDREMQLFDQEFK